MKSWIEFEFKESNFSDDRLKKRLLKLVKDLNNKIGSTILFSCQDWANTKVAYRFFFKFLFKRRRKFFSFPIDKTNKTEGSQEPIEWKLITNLPVNNLNDVAEKFHWYAFRWKIEDFFKILKSGCKINESKLRKAEGVSKLISIYSVISWRIFWMTMLNREANLSGPLNSMETFAS